MYDESIWSSKVLIPLWITQISLQFASILFLASLLADESGTFDIVPASDVIFLICLIITLIVGPLEMLLQSLDRLEPWLYLCCQILKVVFATTFAANELYRYFTLDNRHFFPLDKGAAFAWTLVVNAGFGTSLIILFCASLIYGFLVWRRNRKGHTYAHDEDRCPPDS